MQELYAYLAKHPVVYVTRERERGEGLFPSSDNGTEKVVGYSIVSEQSKSTRELIAGLENPNNAAILVFKANRQVEDVCHAKNWRLLNPPAVLAEQVEGKVSQVKWLGELVSLLPEHWEGELSTCPWSLPFVLQWNWGHSGEGTRMIKTSEQLAEIIKRFPYRKVRITRMINGDTYTNNNIVTKNGILLGNISYQITGDTNLTDNPFATVGNDWNMPKTILTGNEIAGYNNIAQKIGKKLAQDGWRGLYGVDIIREHGTGKMYLIEVNARQPASTTFESQMQQKKRLDSKGWSGLGNKITTFEAHLASLLDLDLTGKELIKIDNGKRTINRKNTI